MAKTVQLDHTEVVTAIQKAMISQLRRDGRLLPGMELGLTFYADKPDAVRVEGAVRHQGQVLFALTGSKANLCAIATELALSKLAPGESRVYRPAADVRWRVVKFTDASGDVDRILVDVEFVERAAKAG